jgi:cell division protein FtsW
MRARISRNRPVHTGRGHTLMRLGALWRDLDLALLAPVLTLSVFGVLAVFWAGLSPQFSSPYVLVKAKVMSLLAGVLLLVCFSKIDYHCYENRRLQIEVTLAVIGFLGLLFVIAPKEFGAILRFLVFNKTIQPSEYVKVVVVVVLSYTITESYRRNLIEYLVFSVHSLFLAILVILIAFQRDYGAVLILLVTALCMLVVARIQAKQSALSAAFAMVLGGVIFLTICGALKEDFYVLDRFWIFLKCLLVKDCDEYQLSNAHSVIISGGLVGNSIMDAIHAHRILPMECNDFIFCVIAEEMGFLGVVLLLFLYLLFIQRGFLVAKHCRDFFGQLMAFGLTWIIGFQAILNVLVATGLFPITGITLPFISHGGNSSLSAMIAVGILLNISKNTS